MTTNNNKTGLKVFEAKKGTICINPYAYNALAVDMKAECSILPLDRLGSWFDAWLKKSGYNKEDFSVCFAKSSKSLSGAYNTTLVFEAPKVNYVSVTYEGLKSFTIKSGVVGFLLIPDVALGWVPEFLHDSLSDIKNTVLSSMSRLYSYSILFSTYIAGEPFSSVKHCSDLPTTGDIVDSLLCLCADGFQSIFDGYLDERASDRAIINRYLTILKSFF